MDAIQFLLLAITLYSLAAIAALFTRARLIITGLGLLAAAAGGLASASALGAIATPAISLLQLPPFGALELQLDLLSALLVGLIALIGFAASLYTSGSPISQGVGGFFTNLFLASMLLVVAAGNAFFFLIFWELMTLLSYFLVIWENEKKDVIRTGYIYMLAAHAGAALLMVAFLLLYQQAGSFDFKALRGVTLSPNLKNVIFILAFLGFGVKAGMAPLHFWTPGAYSAAPSHASALMAAVMKKTAVYGILRFCVDVLGAPAWWWGFVVMAFGAFSTVIGAFYALSERDIKRLLAYSSVENVGIILLGVGVGMTAMAVQLPIVAALGFLAALYHLLNHAFFKSLLFLGAGSLIEQAGTADLNRMGGLGRRMPWTALTFLLACLAVAAIPPLNGFVSEWFTYQALFSASQAPLFTLRVFAPLFAIVLALSGALAVMVYVKAYGGAFSGPPRSQVAHHAREAPRSQRFSLVYLALGCLALGLGAPLAAPWLARVAASVAGSAPIRAAGGWQVFPAEPGQGVLSTPLLALLLLGLLAAPWLIVALYGGRRARRRSGVEPWSCGYGYGPSMSLPASGFDQPVRLAFQPLYRLRRMLDRPFMAIAGAARLAVQNILRAEPVVETAVTRPTTRLVETAGQWIQALQMGDIRVYCLYIILTLGILLIVIFGGSGL
jgi:hydrogenase-4 component B